MLIGVAMTLSPSANFTPWMILGNWLCAASTRLSTASAALRSDGAVAHGGEGALDGVRRPGVLLVLGKEVVEGEQCLAVLLQALGRLVVFDLVAVDERVERGLCAGLYLGPTTALLQSCLTFRCWLAGSLFSTLAVSRVVLGQTSPSAFQKPSALSAMASRPLPERNRRRSLCHRSRPLCGV